MCMTHSFSNRRFCIETVTYTTLGWGRLTRERERTHIEGRQRNPIAAFPSYALWIQICAGLKLVFWHSFTFSYSWIYLATQTLLVHVTLLEQINICSICCRLVTGNSEEHLVSLQLSEGDKIHRPTNLRHHHNLISREIELLDGFAENGFRQTIWIHVSGVESLYACIVTVFIL